MMFYGLLMDFDLKSIYINSTGAYCRDKLIEYAQPNSLLTAECECVCVRIQMLLKTFRYCCGHPEVVNIC